MESDSQKIRAFIALPITLEIRTHLAEMARGIFTNHEQLKIVKPANYHITLAFIGDVNPEILTSLEEPMGLLADSFKEFRISFGRVGFFPGVIFFKVIKGSEKLIDLATAVRLVLRRQGVPYDGKQFKGHLTIARTRDRGANTRDFLTEGSDKMEFDIDSRASEFILYESELTREGPIYTQIASWDLAPLTDSM